MIIRKREAQASNVEVKKRVINVDQRLDFYYFNKTTKKKNIVK